MTEPYVPPRRPLGVSFWVIYANLAAVSLTGALVVGRLQHPEVVSGWTVLPWLIITGAMLYYGLGTWRGNARARDRFVYYVLVMYVLVGIRVLYALAFGDASGSDHGMMWMRLVRSVVLGSLVAWYFLFSRRTDPFFYPEPPGETPSDA